MILIGAKKNSCRVLQVDLSLTLYSLQFAHAVGYKQKNLTTITSEIFLWKQKLFTTGHVRKEWLVLYHLCMIKHKGLIRQLFHKLSTQNHGLESYHPCQRGPGFLHPPSSREGPGTE